MERAFDAYHKWLGIPPECQPPDHYRLLGLQTFESDPDVIQAAADQRMMHLRAYQTGKNSEWSQRLLNEVAAAKVCLLNAAKKAAYDQKLREALGRGSPKVRPAYRRAARPGAECRAQRVSNPAKRTGVAYVRRAKRLPIGPLIIGLASVAVLLIAILAYWAVQHAESPAITIHQADSPSPRAGTHGMATNKPKNGDGAVESGHKVGKAPQVGHPSSTKAPASKETSQKERSHPQSWIHRAP